MKVKKLLFNWRQVGSVHDKDGTGDDYERFSVGENGVILIEEINQALFYNYLIYFKNGTKTRVFNPNLVEYYE